MDLPPTLRLVDVDLPGILDYKVDTLKDQKPKCRYEAIRVDLTDDAKRHAVLTQLGSSTTRGLVVTEGLLIYLTDEQVAALSKDLHAAGGLHWWIIDIAHPRLLKMMQKMWGKSLEAGNAPFKFAPAEGTKFFEKLGWKEVTFRSNMEEAKRLKRGMPGMWFWGLIGKLYPKRIREQFRRFAGTVVMERT
jgi:O-methyltransferase involved in polyketide biosynthesis